MSAAEGLISTVIPVYNRARLLAEAVASVIGQTYRPIEVVIVDDGSTDDTPVAIAGLCAHHRGVVRSIRRANGGPGLARQSGLDIARGEFVQFLDSDDLLLPGKFAAQVAALRAEPAAVAAYGKTRNYVIGEQPKDEAFRRTGELFATLFPSFLVSRWWATSTPLYRRSVLDRIGPLTALRNEEDWEFDCRLAALGAPIARCDTFVSDHRFHDGERLSTGGTRDPVKLRDRAEAHRLVLGHARRAGIASDAPEMRHYTRDLFLLARQCGVAGLPEQSRMLIGCARDAMGDHPDRRLMTQLRVYEVLAGMLGWQTAGQAARALDEVRNFAAPMLGRGRS